MATRARVKYPCWHILKSTMKHCTLSLVAALLLGAVSSFAENASPREKLLMDFEWCFAFDEATDPAKDFDPAPVGEMFNYLTKSGNARGAAQAKFDDSSWRKTEIGRDS